MRKLRVPWLCAVLAPMLGVVAHAQIESRWLNAVSGNWTDASRWSTTPNFPNNGTPPGTTYDALIDSFGAYTVSNNANINIASLRVKSLGAMLDHSGGILTVGAGSTNVGVGGTIRVSGGTLAANGNVIVTGRLEALGAGQLAPGPMSNLSVMSGGSMDIPSVQFVNGALTINTFGSVAFGSLHVGQAGSSTMLLEDSGSRLEVSDVARWGSAAGNATITIRNSAIFARPSDNLGAAVALGIDGGAGTLNISSGAQFEAGNLGVGIDPSGIVPTPGIATAMLSGGTSSITLNLSLQVGAASAGAGTFVQSGGTLTVSTFPSSGSRVLIDNTGTLLITGGVFDPRRQISVHGLLRVSGSGTMTPGTSTRLLTVTNGGRAVFEQGWVVPAGTLSVSNGTLEVGTTLSAINTGFIRYENGGNFITPRIELTGGGRMVLSPGANKTLRVTSMLIDSASRLDLSDNRSVIDYTGASPLNDVRSWIIAGFNSGNWGGNGIMSSTAATTAGRAIGYAESSSVFSTFPAVFGGVQVDDTAVLIAYTRVGDANLDGTVSLADFNRIAANFGMNNTIWSRGDFNYDGMTNLADFNLMAANFGLSAVREGPTPTDWDALASAIPEPSGLMLVIAAATLCLRRLL